MLRFLKIFGYMMGGLLLLLCLAVASLKLPQVQKYIKVKALELLSEKLGTKVSLDEAGVSVSNGSIGLYGLNIDDRAGERLLAVDTLFVRLDLWKAYKEKNIELEGVKLNGVTANVYKTRSDSAANYQFVLDAFKNDKKKDEQDTKSNLEFDLKQATLSRLSFSYQDRSKHPHPTQFYLGEAKYDGSKMHIVVKDAKYATNNGKPRKNTGKPNRGAFDAGHLDIVANVDLTIDNLSKDSTLFTVNNISGSDRGSGLVLDSLRLKGAFHKGVFTLTGVRVVSRHTWLNLDKVTLNLPDSTRALSYSSPLVKGYTILSDISQPFAPVLKKFSTPLTLTVGVTGDAHTMQFHNINVATTDCHLGIKASGSVAGLGHGQKKDVKFTVSSMYAQGGVKEKIISHFPVKESMMGIIKAAGNITYNGNLHVIEKPSKHVILGGRLGTRLGGLNFTIDIDQKQKYLVGIAGTDKFAVGELVGSKDFKNIAFNADFKFNIAGKKAAKELHRHLGKLPIGYIKGTASEATYKSLTLHNLVWDITSDGDMAHGTGGMQGKLADVMCEFSFVDTDFEHHLKVKPSLKFHNIFSKKDKSKDKDKDKKDKSKDKDKKDKSKSKDKDKDSKDNESKEPKKKNKFLFWKK